MSEGLAAEEVPSEGGHTWGDRLRRLRVDTGPLRESRDFRLLFWAGSVFYLGGMVSYVALPYQLHALTGSNFAVGLLGAVELVPLVGFGLWGGALADHVDRRTMVTLSAGAQVVLTAGLMLNALLPEPRVWAIYALGACLSAAQSLQRPSREALIPRTVRHEQLPAAVALSSLGAQVGLLAGPALGGLLIQWAGVPWCYAVDVGGLVAATALFGCLRPYPALDRSTPPSLAAMAEGVRYAVRRRDLLGTYVIDIVAMLMAMPTVLFPALATEVLRQPAVLGLLYSAGTVGSLLATATSGWTSRVHRHGRAVVLAAAAWGAAIAGVGLVTSAWAVLVLLAVAGAADMVSGIFRSTIWHQTIPDSMRGRLAGIEMLSYSIGPLGGQTRAGLVADRWGVRASITSGGVLCVLGVIATTAWLRGFWHYDDRTDEHAVRERQLRAAASPAAR
ncbi:MAG TPA: MFS transporter [Dermatophilaceae bacterium]|nr:MFS transporter [Dermatophilaceae bacterium]